MADFLIGLLANFLNAVKEWFQDIVLFLFDWFVGALLFLFRWVIALVTMVLDFVWGVVGGLGFSTAWSGLPVPVLEFLNRVDIVAICLILLGAVTARVILNLIPTWATRV